MGKMKLKLWHVMPHSWFYKLKVVNKIGGSRAPYMTMSDSKATTSSSSSCARKVTYASPINHKAIDIAFPAETPKRSPRAEPSGPDDFAPFDQLDLVEYRPSVVLPSTFSIRHISDEIMDAASTYRDGHELNGPPSASKARAGVFSYGASFDVRELEARLKALGSEDRKKYYTSPLWSPSPIMDVQEYSLDDTGNDRKGKLLMRSAELDYEDTGRVDGFCRSIGEHTSSSSSDTGVERGSSSMWERDIFSITSDGSEAFTNAPDIDVESSLMPLRSGARYRFRKLQERMSSTLDSPLYGHGHMDRSMSRFCEQHAHTPHERIHARLYEDDRIVSYASVCDEHEIVHDGRDCPYVTNGDMDEGHAAISDDVGGTSDETVGDPHIDGENTRHMFVHKDVRSASYAHIEDLHASNAGIRSTWSDNNEITMHRDKCPPFNPSPSMDYQTHEDTHSESGKRPLAGFSYARCKERLLSSKAMELNNTTMMERAPEKISNYAKFKLKKMGMYSDPGLFNMVSKAHACDMDSMTSPNIVRSRFAPQMRSRSLHCPGKTTSNHAKSLYIDRAPAGRINNRCGAECDGHSRANGTLRVVREKIKDPSFQQFSKASPGRTSASPESRVFDSFAMVKCSYDPKEDFKQSMVEMIMEKDLQSSHDMVELLQCYLTLNAEVYHDTIVKVFTEVWSETFKHV